MNDTMKRVLAMSDDTYVPRSVVASLCEACAEKMKAKGIKAVKASIVKKAIKDTQKKAFYVPVQVGDLVDTGITGEVYVTSIGGFSTVYVSPNERDIEKGTGRPINRNQIRRIIKVGSSRKAQSQVPKLELSQLPKEIEAMNRVAVAKELVAIAKLIARYQYDEVIEGEEFRLSMMSVRGDFLLEEMPQKGMKRCRIWKGDVAPWVSRVGGDALGHINLPNVVRGIHASMSYDQVQDSMTKAMETLAKEASEKSEAAGGKTYNVKDLFGYWESQVHFLQVEPTDSKPFIVEGKDFKVSVSWTEYKAYDPSSDFQQADPHYTLYTQTSAAAARKLYKMLRADPDALKTMAWASFKNWLDKNGVGCDTQFSVWH